MMRAIAQFISVVFHPIVLFVYIMVTLLIVNPYMFGYNNIYEAKDFILLIVVTVVPIPILSVLMLKGLGWADTVFLRKKQERIAPYLITGMLYLTLYLQLSKTNAASAIQITTLAAVITLFSAFFVNNFFKISLHAAGAGALISVLIIALMFFTGETFVLRINNWNGGEYPTINLLYISIIVSGLICTSRLYLKQHDMREVYTGVVLGFFAPLIAYYIIM